ncbi:MAG: type II secretion system protein [Prosthecobacter sp.]
MNSFLDRFRPAFTRRGFSLVEMMACVSIIGIISFMAIPSVTRMRSDSERNLVIARAEALNLAQASFVQVRGRTQAALEWAAASNDGRYALLLPYLSYSETNLTTFMCGYEARFGNSVAQLSKVLVFTPTGSRVYY